ncbi:LysR family transcriptional regulator [Prosthecomicrobium hirschii]|uniref:LysR family transcriptional regulator n=1 Tax=Prosthecodimorpha hirschii TaxID=665126 RepID=UPI00222099B7|nr:LysR family transcriptional regulator [Prosthecomicrobium hirschii]MCW1841551.1 LysR family transcriptional regulator [Prosthecomicrobium hirschii]
MTPPDLNLLVTLDVLLTEGSVAGAARRLRLSPSAMSRQLARLRAATGDPLLVRAGRGLVPTPRAVDLRERAGSLVEAATALLRPEAAPDLARLERRFTMRNREGFVETFGPALLARLEREAPGVQLCFLPKPDKDSAPLRDGGVDLETGVVAAATGPELRAQALFRDRFVGVVRCGHPLAAHPLAAHPLAAGPVTAERYASARHVAISRRGREHGPVDAALAARGLERRIATVVATFSEALALARATDLVATVPERYTGRLRDGMASFALPVALADLTISLLWHPRLEADPAHRWLRGVVREICGGVPATGAPATGAQASGAPADGAQAGA